MSDEVYDFLEKKQQELQESKNFLKWNENNKLQDENGDPVIAFHGSTQKMFDSINSDFFNSNSYFFGGFYLSESIDDVNDNYAGVGADLKSTAGTLADSLSDVYSFEDLYEEHFEEDALTEEEKEKFIEFLNEGATLSEFKKSFNFNYDHIIEKIEDFGDYYKIEDSEQDPALSSNQMALMLLIEKKYQHSGWVAPLVVKMENPCYSGFGDSDTLFSFSGYDSDEIIAMEEENVEEYPAYENGMSAIKDIYYSQELPSTKFIESFEMKVAQGEEGFMSDLFDAARDVLIENFDYEEELAISICKKYFQENAPDELTFDEDGYPEIDETIYIPNYERLNGNVYEDESYERGEEFINALQNEGIEMGKIFEALEVKLDVPMNIEEIKITLAECLYDDEESLSFFNALSSIYDGIVMNAYEANRKNWGGGFDLDYNTKHYIVFKEDSVKSIIGNNGEYSLYNNDFIERRTEKNKKERLNALKKPVLEKHLDYIKSTWSEMPDVQLISNGIFKDEKTDAVLDRKKNIIYLNKDNIDSIETLEKVLIHETVAHYGLHHFFSNEINDLLEKVSTKYEKEIEIMRSRNYPHLNSEKDKLKLAEEFVAFEAEKILPKDSFLKKVKNELKKHYIKFKKLIGLNTKINEDMFLMIKESEELLKGNKKKKRNYLKRNC